MSSSFEPTKKTWVEQFTLKQNPTICRQASACKSWDFFLYHLKMLQRIHNGILFFLQTLGLFGILGFWLIVSLPLFFVNNKAADNLPLAESISGFHESSNPLDAKNRHPLFSECRFCYPIVRFDFWRKWRKFGVNPLLHAPKIKCSCGFQAVISTCRPYRPCRRRQLREQPGVRADQRPGSRWSAPSRRRMLRSPERSG